MTCASIRMINLSRNQSLADWHFQRVLFHWVAVWWWLDCLDFIQYLLWL